MVDPPFLANHHHINSFTNLRLKGMATITNPLVSLDHSGHPQLPVCARRQGGQAEDAHHGQVRRHQFSTFHHLQVTSDHSHHNHWRTNWRTAKYGVTNLAPLRTDQLPIITTILTLIRLVADLLSAGGADHVVTMDLHAGQIQVTLQTLQLCRNHLQCKH